MAMLVRQPRERGTHSHLCLHAPMTPHQLKGQQLPSKYVNIMKLPIPCSVVTGTLGVGKTTFITSLLATKPSDEKWAVLVNEFGSLGLDGALLGGSGASSASSGVFIRELAGGCLCCQVSGMLSVAIAQLLRQAKPDRLIIEPSGLGHPAVLLKMLQSGHLAPALQVQAVICLVDVRTACDLYEDSPASADQIDVSDILVGNKTDLATDQQVQGFLSWAKALEPSKSQVLTCSHGAIANGLELLHMPHSDAQASLLASPGSRARRQQRSALNASGSAGDATTDQVGVSTDQPALLASLDQPASAPTADRQGPGPEPGKPTRRVTSSSKEHVACGWCFHSADVFNQTQLEALLGKMMPCVVRLKGVFRVSEAEWMAINWVRSSGKSPAADLVFVPTSGTHEDSRVEVIIETSLSQQGNASPADDEVQTSLTSKDWAALEGMLTRTTQV